MEERNSKRGRERDSKGGEKERGRYRYVGWEKGKEREVSLKVGEGKRERRVRNMHPALFRLTGYNPPHMIGKFSSKLLQADVFPFSFILGFFQPFFTSKFSCIKT